MKKQKKNKTKKLVLSKESLRKLTLTLTDEQLDKVAGASGMLSIFPSHP